MTGRTLSRAEMVGLLKTEPVRRAPWSVVADLHRKNTSFRFLSEFAGLSLVVLIATGSGATIRSGPQRAAAGPAVQVPAASEAASPSNTREAALAHVAEAIAPPPEAAPTPSLYHLGAQAVASAPAAIRDRLTSAIELYRQHATAPAVLASLQGLDPAEPNTAFVRGLATIALGGTANAAAGIAELKHSAEAGHVAAAAFYGLAQMVPPAALERDAARGRLWLQKAADAGDHDAQFLLGYALSTGWAGLADPAAAATLLKAAVDGGNLDAMKLLAGFYLVGRGVAKSADACEHYLRMAMTAGDTDAQGLFGAYLVSMSVAGWGQSLDEGATWLSRAAEAGDPKAMHMLGMVHVEYAKTPPLRDMKAGVDWFERCAALKDPECEFALGHAYAEGIGRAKNLALAASNFALAAAGGMPRAAAELAKVERGLSDDDRAVASMSGGVPGALSAMKNDPRIPSFADRMKQLDLK